MHMYTCMYYQARARTRTLTLTLTLTLTRYKELEPLLRQSVDTFRAYPVKAVALGAFDRRRLPRAGILTEFYL